ncbi:MAG: hypothetical protein R3F60_05435 [bacterium]
MMFSLLVHGVLLQPTLDHLLDRALFEPDGSFDAPTVARELRRLCAAEEPVACLLLSPPVDAAAAEAWCATGDPDACALVAWLAREEPPLVARARQRAACATGGGQACVLAAVFGAVTPAEGARIAEAACREGHPLGCLLRARLEPDRTIRRAQLTALCEEGDRRGCRRALALATGAEAARLRGLACSLGEAAACRGTSAATGAQGRPAPPRR